MEENTYPQISQENYGITEQTCTEFIKNCETCAQTQGRAIIGKTVDPIVYDGPMNHLIIDLINKYCLTGMDGWSKYPFAESLFDKTSVGIADKIHCDNGGEFEGA